MSDLQPFQIEKLLTEIVSIKEDQLNTKALLKHYKISSDNLSRLQNAKKDLQAQIEEEKRQIEENYFADEDYKKAIEDEMKQKIHLREKNTQLKELLAKVRTNEELSTYNYNINGENIKMQVEKSLKVYLNGKEAK